MILYFPFTGKMSRRIPFCMSLRELYESGFKPYDPCVDIEKQTA